MKNVVLASSSPRRKELLKKCNIEPIIVKPSIKERISTNKSNEQIAMSLAFEKANQVAGKFNQAYLFINLWKGA